MSWLSSLCYMWICVRCCGLSSGRKPVLYFQPLAHCCCCFCIELHSISMYVYTILLFRIWGFVGWTQIFTHSVTMNYSWLHQSMIRRAEALWLSHPKAERTMYVYYYVLCMLVSLLLCLVVAVSILCIEWAFQCCILSTTTAVSFCSTELTV